LGIFEGALYKLPVFKSWRIVLVFFLVFVLVLQLCFCVFMGFEPAIEDK